MLEALITEIGELISTEIEEVLEVKNTEEKNTLTIIMQNSKKYKITINNITE